MEHPKVLLRFEAELRRVFDGAEDDFRREFGPTAHHGIFVIESLDEGSIFGPDVRTDIVVTGACLTRVRLAMSGFELVRISDRITATNHASRFGPTSPHRPPESTIEAIPSLFTRAEHHPRPS